MRTRSSQPSWCARPGGSSSERRSTAPAPIAFRRVTAAIFGLLGVLVGGVLNGVVQWRLEVAGTRAAARGARRLVAEELVGDLSKIVSSIGNATTTLLHELEHGTWSEHKATLANATEDDDWFQIIEAYTALEVLGQVAPVGPAPGMTDSLEQLARPAGQHVLEAVRRLQEADPRLALLEALLNKPVGSLRQP
jgi:hypothetical protein